MSDAANDAGTHQFFQNIASRYSLLRLFHLLRNIFTSYGTFDALDNAPFLTSRFAFRQGRIPGRIQEGETVAQAEAARLRQGVGDHARRVLPRSCFSRMGT
jgi:hypothetical protein